MSYPYPSNNYPPYATGGYPNYNYNYPPPNNNYPPPSTNFPPPASSPYPATGYPAQPYPPASSPYPTNAYPAYSYPPNYYPPPNTNTNYPPQSSNFPPPSNTSYPSTNYPPPSTNTSYPPPSTNYPPTTGSYPPQSYNPSGTTNAPVYQQAYVPPEFAQMVGSTGSTTSTTSPTATTANATPPATGSFCLPPELGGHYNEEAIPGVRNPGDEYGFKFTFNNKVQFYGALVEVVKIIQTTSKELYELLKTTNNDNIMKSAPGLVEKDKMNSAKISAIIQYGKTNILKDSTQTSYLETVAEALTAAIVTLIASATEFIANALKGTPNTDKLKIKSVDQRYVAVTFRIKSLLSAADMLKVEKEVAAAEPASGVTFTAGTGVKKSEQLITRGKVGANFNTSRYKQDQVEFLQDLYRKTVLRTKLRAIVAEWKESKESEGSRKRVMVLKEIISTEKTYVESLFIAINFYLKPMQRDAKAGTRQFLNTRDVGKLFGTLEMIAAVNGELLSQLQNSMKNYPTVNIFGDVYLNMSKQLKVYSTYINSFDESTEVLKRLMANKDFPVYVKELQQKSNSTLDLSSLLIQPVQRLPRYQLLIQELIKCTEKDHVDYINLNKALDVVKDLNKYVNERKRVSDNKAKISELQKKITQMPIVLEQPHRVFVQQGELNGFSQTISRRRNSEVFLFNDIMIRARTITKDDKWEYEEHVTLAGLDIQKLPGSASFVVKKKDAEWTFFTKDTKDLDAWYEQLKTTIDAWEIHELCNSETEKVDKKNDGVQILSATYGVLSDTRQCVDVTDVLKQWVQKQGGKRLNLDKGTKSTMPGFTDPTKKAHGGLGISLSSFKRPKKELTVVWRDSRGSQPYHRTWDDDDVVEIVDGGK